MHTSGVKQVLPSHSQVIQLAPLGSSAGRASGHPVLDAAAPRCAVRRHLGRRAAQRAVQLFHVRSSSPIIRDCTFWQNERTLPEAVTWHYFSDGISLELRAVTLSRAELPARFRLTAVRVQVPGGLLGHTNCMAEPTRVRCLSGSLQSPTTPLVIGQQA